MMALILALPVLGLVLFYILPFKMALPLYLLLLFISGLIYYGMFTVMGKKRKVRTGFEEMMGQEALVVEDVSPRGKVLIYYEIWSARARGKSVLKGDKVRICGHQGLTLVVESLTEEQKSS
jgi:membrane-bound serine protease (ClpP class)